jgi:hypothetical protein
MWTAGASSLPSFFLGVERPASQSVNTTARAYRKGVSVWFGGLQSGDANYCMSELSCELG